MTLAEGLLRHLDEAALARLAAARVGIAGAGGLGSNCAMLLARSGVRHFVIADHDVVEPSNLNRQHYLPQHVGQPKVDALAQVLRAIEPALNLTMHRVRIEPANVGEVFAGCDILVEAMDDVGAKRMFVEHAMEAGRFVVSASGMGGWGGPQMTSRNLGDRLVLVGDFTSEVGPGLPALAPRVMLAAALQADAVLCRILGPCDGA